VSSLAARTAAAVVARLGRLAAAIKDSNQICENCQTYEDSKSEQATVDIARDVQVSCRFFIISDQFACVEQFGNNIFKNETTTTTALTAITIN